MKDNNITVTGVNKTDPLNSEVAQKPSAPLKEGDKVESKTQTPPDNSMKNIYADALDLGARPDGTF